MKIKQLILAIVAVFSLKGFSQQSVNTSGGNASSATGNISYSIGQTFTNTFFSSNHSLSEGVHQAFEISTLGVDNQPSINLEMKVFPNPTASMLYLSYPNYSKNKSKYNLFDASGRLVRSANISSQESQIDLQIESSGMYILQVFSDNQILKSFRIIKN
ncbi:T9SS type A sorting domain-containing protein [Soonwooa purpurea]